jgi:cobyric acid synthase
MNPVLLKPESDMRSQVVLMGRPAGSLHASYLNRKRPLWRQVRQALDSLREDYDLVVIEGAGSPAEINLRKGDIVNMRVARHAQAPVLLVGDIDNGGVAHLVGTLALLTPSERRLVASSSTSSAALHAAGARSTSGSGPRLPCSASCATCTTFGWRTRTPSRSTGRRCPEPPAAAINVAVVRLPFISASTTSTL